MSSRLLSCIVVVVLWGSSGIAAEDAPRYVINSVDLGGGNIELIRTDSATGECWRMMRDRWSSLDSPALEEGEPGTFDVCLIRISQEAFMIGLCRN